MSVLSKGRSRLHVLLIEDSRGDVRLLQEAFLTVSGDIPVHVAMDGVEAMLFLEQKEPYTDAPRPDLILLDLNLPRMDGREVLARIKSDDNLKTIPTIILTTSEAEDDITQSYQLHANCYLIKPVQFDDFETLIASLDTFWFQKARLPEGTQA